MEVYKFGGASVRDASGIKNLASLVSGNPNKLVVVISALGKTTNDLEKVVDALCNNDPDLELKITTIENFHRSIIKELSGDQESVVSLEDEFSKFRSLTNSCDTSNYNILYDQVVSYGEIWSTLIVNAWLKKSDIDSRWIDIREVLISDKRFRDANVDWDLSSERIKAMFTNNNVRVSVTQGFICGTIDGQVTTLGREGSDFTAAILANILDAEKTTIWKDVPGVLNADPNWMTGTSILNSISYKEAVEMSFSGAKVIHPKTIKPLHNKGIPLFVRSFVNPDDPGTVISTDKSLAQDVPLYIKKENQVLLSIMPKDFSFVIGDNLGILFNKFYENGIKSNLVQTSAISISVSIDDDLKSLNKLIDDISGDYKVLINKDVELITLRYYTTDAIKRVTENREILLEQRTRRSIRYILKQVASQEACE